MATMFVTLQGKGGVGKSFLTAAFAQWLVDRGLNPVAVMDFVGGVGAGIACCGLQLTSGILLAGTGAGARRRSGARSATY